MSITMGAGSDGVEEYSEKEAKNKNKEIVAKIWERRHVDKFIN